MQKRVIVAFGTLIMGVSALTSVANAAPGDAHRWQQQLQVAAQQAANTVRTQDAAQKRLQTQQRLKDGSGQGQQHRYQHQYRYEHQQRSAMPEHSGAGAGRGQPQGSRGAMGGGGRRGH